MSEHKEGKTSDGKLLHYSVGAVIEKDGKYLLVDRVKPPFGFAGLAGHVDEGESPDATIVREIMEESGLKVVNSKLLFEEEILWNYCSSRSPPLFDRCRLCLLYLLYNIRDCHKNIQKRPH